MLDENMTQEEINKDILVSNAYKPRLSFSMVDRQYEYFYNCVYRLNWSEERQRVFQVLANIIKMNIGDLGLDDLSTDEDYKKSLYMFSKEFRDYSIMRDKFETFVKNTEDGVKQ